jgi:hypothetical protein
MTSRRSEDNATTADWRSEKDGLYFDSTWSADSQGRKKPASTQITVTPSASILETSRAAQAANRERLDRRENEAKTEAEAVQKIKREKAEQKANKKEVTRGVPENKIRTVLPKRRFGDGFAWIMQEQMLTFGEESFAVPSTQFPGLTAQGWIKTLQLDDSKLAASKSISKGKNALNSFTYKVDYLASRKEWIAPHTGDADLVPVTYGGTVYSKSTLPKDPEVYASCTVIDQTKTSLVFSFSGSLEGKIDYTTQTPTSVFKEKWTRQRYLLTVGLYVPLQKLSKEAYIYSFVKVEPNTEAPLLISGNYLTRLSKLKPTTKYPETVITGNPQDIFITRSVITPTFKQQVAEWLKQGILDYTQAPLNYFAAFPEVGYMGHIEMDFWAQAQLPELDINQTTDTPINTVKEETYPFNQTVEIIYTEEDYGPLVLQ